MLTEQPRRKSEIEIRGHRVAMRPIRDDDIPTVEPWYREAMAAAHGAPSERESVQGLHYRLKVARADLDGGLLGITRHDNPAPIGLLDFRVDSVESGWLTVDFIGLARSSRGWGYGSEAVRLLEAEALRRRWANRFRAEVDARNGLGLYFWLRLGYHPAGPSEHAWRSRSPRDMICMVRLPDS